MQELHLFEYAVIRVVPKVEREEFINVGIILYCAKQKFLKSLFHLNQARLNAFACETETDFIWSNLLAIEKICEGKPGSGPIGQLDMASRFRWLTATRSTVVQASKVHPGFCIDAQETLEKLHQQLVL